jgi:hypothetical protein
MLESGQPAPDAAFDHPKLIMPTARRMVITWSG